MSMIYKTFDIEIKEKRENGGRIMISTGSYDRDSDRVIPGGGKFTNYLKNPVVQYGHNYREPWATVGRTLKLEITKNGIIADFELRPAANESDPQNVVLLLWNGDWVRTASIGFMALKREDNEREGIDFSEWELLEWSLVPIPSNQEALRQAVKAMQAAPIKNTPQEQPATEQPAESQPGKTLPNSNDKSSAGALYDSPPAPHSAPESTSKVSPGGGKGENDPENPIETPPSGEGSLLEKKPKVVETPEGTPNVLETPENDEKPPKAPETPENATPEELDAPESDEALLDAIEAFVDEVAATFDVF